MTKLRLTTSGCFYKEKDKVKLEGLGFKFKTTEEVYGKFTHKKWYLEQDYDNPLYIEIKSLEELMQFSEEWNSVILSNGEIEIYDDYIE